MRHSDLTIPMVQVRNNCAIFYELFIGSRRAPQQFEEHLALARTKAYSGIVTAAAEKNIRKAVDLLIQASPKRIIYNTVSQKYQTFQLGFWTLTISDRAIQPHREVAKKCLIPFCDWMRKKNITYIWKAELQERGQIHYHITANQFCEYYKIQKQWNKLQRKAGYLNGYAKQYGHYNANSIDVHAVHNLKDIEAYLVKYICKNSGQQIHGKVWGCSRSLTGKRFTTEVDSTIWVNALKGGITYLDYCSVAKTKGRLLLGKTDLLQYQNFLKQII